MVNTICYLYFHYFNPRARVCPVWLPLGLRAVRRECLQVHMHKGPTVRALCQATRVNVHHVRVIFWVSRHPLDRRISWCWCGASLHGLPQVDQLSTRAKIGGKDEDVWGNCHPSGVHEGHVNCGALRGRIYRVIAALRNHVSGQPSDAVIALGVRALVSAEVLEHILGGAANHDIVAPNRSRVAH
eukprot:1192311-Prorocentrum_minimum.AAC.1